MPEHPVKIWAMSVAVSIFSAMRQNSLKTERLPRARLGQKHITKVDQMCPLSRSFSWTGNKVQRRARSYCASDVRCT